MTFSQKRKRIARRMLRLIEWKLRKMYEHGWSFPQSEQQLLFERSWYEAQRDHCYNFFTGTWQPKTSNLQPI